MELLYLQPILVEGRGLSVVARQVAAFQIQRARVAVFDCKAPRQIALQVEALHPATHCLLNRQFQLTDPYKASFVLVCFVQRTQAVVHERTDEVFTFLEEELEVHIKGKPAVGQDIAEIDGVRHAGGYHRTHRFILDERRRPIGWRFLISQN